MTSNYPNNGIIYAAADRLGYVCLAGVANYTITVSADVPESCFFLFYVDDQPPVEFSNTSFYNRVLQFTGTNFTYIYNKTKCDGENYTGYVLQVDGHYIEPVKNKIISADIPLIVGSSSGSLVVVCLIVMGFAFWYIKQRQRWYNQLFKILKEMNISAKEISEMKAKSDELLLPHGKIHINFDEMLGKGVSSTVYKGFLMGSSPLSEQQNWPKFVDCEVAVKVSSHFGKVEVEQLFKEIDAMKKIGYHKNVMCMLGMEYISSKGLIHRDIAARNILLFNSIVAKISDFGLCIHEDEPAVYRTASNLKLPIRWLALESLTEGIFSHKTDIWSFGILMHEMFSFGQIPYANVNNDELIVFLQSGGRLEPPKNMGIELSGVMFSCWDRDPEARPRFGKIEETLKELIKIT
uniref:Protein kinase domain-containing protein n=1 Tax=Acrobeloides nanus TaxID=290746 RepID=A0A914E6C0_9BILA